MNSDVDRLFDPAFVSLMTTVATKCSKEACDWVGRVSLFEKRCTVQEKVKKEKY